MSLSDKVRDGWYSWPTDCEEDGVDLPRLAEDIEKLERQYRIAGLKEAEKICDRTPAPSIERAGYYAATSASDAAIGIRLRIKSLERGDPV